MDQETYDQPAIQGKTLGDAVNYLKEGMECKLTFYQGEPLDIDIPITVDLLVTRAEPAVRGDTATGVTKKVKTETGLEVQVPAFVNEGDTVRVDTRTGAYLTRV
jgi:elongation factor P